MEITVTKTNVKKKGKRHIWEKDDNGKYCVKCGSRINYTLGMVKYIEVDMCGVGYGVNWYPRCQYD